MLASKSFPLTDISDQFHETIHKANTVKRFSNYFSTGIPDSVAISYLCTTKRVLPSEPVILVDKSDVVKPDRKQFKSPDSPTGTPLSQYMNKGNGASEPQKRGS